MEIELTEEEVTDAVHAFQETTVDCEGYRLNFNESEIGILAVLESLGIGDKIIAKIRAKRLEETAAEDAERERRRIEKRAATPPDTLAMQDRLDVLLSASILRNMGQRWKGIFDFSAPESSSPQVVWTNDKPMYKHAVVIEKPNE